MTIRAGLIPVSRFMYKLGVEEAIDRSVKIDRGSNTYQWYKFFDYKEDKMSSKRESELLQQHLEKYGHLPSGRGDEDDLFQIDLPSSNSADYP